MTKITYTNPGAARPDVGSLGPSGAERAEDSRKIRQAATIPLVISLGAQWVFFIHYWIPETSAFPANELWLTQLSPLASAALTSEGQPQVQAQNGQWGLPALVLLICAFALFWLSRTRHWLGRTAMLAPAALGLIAALASVIGLAARGELRSTMIGVLLLIIWVWSAGYASLHGFLDNLAPLPRKSWHSGLPLLAAYAIVGPAPTAVGAGCSLRSYATPRTHCRTTRWRCDSPLCGPQQCAALPLRTAARRRCLGRLPGMAAAPRCCVHRPLPDRDRHPDRHGCRRVASDQGRRERVTELTYESPADEVHFSCGSWILDQPTTVSQQREPAKTLVISGFTCRTVTTFAGYQQLSTGISMSRCHPSSPIRLRAPRSPDASSRPSTVRSSSSRALTGSMPARMCSWASA